MLACLGMLVAQSLAELDPEFCRAADYLFAHGMTDPRGGELRHVEVVAGWGENKVWTIGWVLPDTEKNSARVVLSNGLLYTPKQLGRRADVEELFALPQQGFGRGSGFSPLSEVGLRRDLLYVMLYRTGNTGLVDLRYGYQGSSDVQRLLICSFLGPARAKAVHGFLRGDYKSVVEELEEVAKHRQALSDGMKGASEVFNLSGVDDLRMLVDVARDARRRMHMASPKPLNVEENRKLSVSVQVTNLIQAFEYATEDKVQEVSEELFAIGEPAIEPLLRAVRYDARLSETVAAMWRANDPVMVVPVWRRAESCLGRMFCGYVPSSVDQEQAAKNLRSFWGKHSDRGYSAFLIGVIDDDEAPAEQWSNAVKMYGETAESKLIDAQRREIIAEKVRRRIAESPFNQSSLDGILQASWATQAWGKSGVAIMQVARQRLESFAEVASGPNSGVRFPYAGYAELLAAAIRQGDWSGVEGYCEVVHRADFESLVFSSDLEGFLAPVVIGHLHPQLFQIADSVFRPGGSLDLRPGATEFRTFSSRLLSLPSFTDFVIETLDREEVVEYGSNAKGEPARLPLGDVAALQLSHLKGAPRFHIEWGVEKRREARKQIRQFLERNRERLLELVNESDPNISYYPEKWKVVNPIMQTGPK